MIEFDSLSLMCFEGWYTVRMVYTILLPCSYMIGLLARWVSDVYRWYIIYDLWRMGLVNRGKEKEWVSSKIGIFGIGERERERVGYHSILRLQIEDTIESVTIEKKLIWMTREYHCSRAFWVLLKGYLVLFTCLVLNPLPLLDWERIWFLFFSCNVLLYKFNLFYKMCNILYSVFLYIFLGWAASLYDWSNYPQGPFLCVQV